MDMDMKMKIYNLRIPAKLHAEFKAQAAYKEETMNVALAKMVLEYTTATVRVRDEGGKLPESKASYHTGMCGWCKKVTGVVSIIPDCALAKVTDRKSVV